MSLTSSILSKTQLFQSLRHSTSRSFATVILPITANADFNSYSAPNFISDDETVNCYPHPFVEEGPELPCELLDNDEAVYARADLPGVSKEGVKMWVRDDSIYVKGVEEAKKVSLYSNEEPPRKYFFNIDLPRNEYRVEDIRAVMDHGVLRVLVPKIKPEESDDAFATKVE